MEKYPILMLMFALCTMLFACKDEDSALDPETKALVQTLELELEPLSEDPISWTDEQLQFLDPVSDRAIIGLGEATHGTAEFFKAKHRMLRYLVEHHNYKVFAIEADFGESLFINEAVQNSDKSQIENLMKTKMHFWTWTTEEVRDLLYWMCDYNVGKSENEKVRYWGVDCQFNTYHPDMVKNFLAEVNVSFFHFAEAVLDEAKSGAANQFSGYSKDGFDNLLGRIDALRDSVMKYQADIIDASSERRYQLNLQLINVTRQTSEVTYYAQKTTTKNYRDQYMAENVGWLHEYFAGAGIVLWAHNYHISHGYYGGAMGYRLKTDFPGDYFALGFLFSKGFFTAMTRSGNQNLGLDTQDLKANPKSGSMNDLMSRANSDVFTVSISDLQKHNEWTTAFSKGIEYFQVGAVYNNKPTDYYFGFDPDYFEQLIYFDHTTAAVQLK
ncbi:MAG TPA: erythromycin esterase family protein [Cyclobacteriaceae bacterium]|nr:erythromycin esterase family protein [Cyclobacteriaceae bacterium]